MVREDYQGLGIASYLLQELEKIATENGFKSFAASVLKENSKMIHVFKKKYPNAKVSLSTEDDYRIQMDFYDAIEHPGDWFG